MATSENGIGTSTIPEDIIEEVRQELSRFGLQTPHPRVRFDDTPVFIELEQKVDEYNIIEDIKDQKANVKVEQLLHDNTNYQKLIRDAWTKKIKRRFKLPSVVVILLHFEDYGAQELTMEVDGCIIPKVSVDSGLRVNLMLEDPAFDLGYTSFEATDQVLRMAGQSKLIPVGQHSQVPTLIGEVTYLLIYVIIRVSSRRPFSMLLRRPWLYSVEVLIDWGAKEFVFGKPRIGIPQKIEEHLGETSKSDGYTTDWSDPEEASTAFSYFVDQFAEMIEMDFNFPIPIPELVNPQAIRSQDEEQDQKQMEGQLEDQSLGEINIPLSFKWIRQ